MYSRHLNEWNTTCATTTWENGKRWYFPRAEICRTDRQQTIVSARGAEVSLLYIIERPFRNDAWPLEAGDPPNISPVCEVEKAMRTTAAYTYIRTCIYMFAYKFTRVRCRFWSDGALSLWKGKGALATLLVYKRIGVVYVYICVTKYLSVKEWEGERDRDAHLLKVLLPKNLCNNVSLCAKG